MLKRTLETAGEPSPSMRSASQHGNHGIRAPQLRAVRQDAAHLHLKAPQRHARRQEGLAPQLAQQASVILDRQLLLQGILLPCGHLQPHANI
jgi:hypothetical protein